MIHIYCGDGKGKTTASIGLAVRAAGSGLRVLFVQFLKGRLTGELKILASIDSITVMRARSSQKFTYQLTEEERTQQKVDHEEMLKRVFQMMKENRADMLILDEVITAVSSDVIREELLREYVEEFDENCELVMTGRSPERWMIDAADYVTDMEKIRHPFDQGTEARRGIEF